MDRPETAVRIVPHPGRGLTALLFVIAAGGWLMRVLPFLWRGSLDLRILYDEAAYFVSAVHLADGLVPYRDFVYVHPPGFLYVLGLVAGITRGWELPAGLDAARWMIAMVGAVNVFLVGRLAGSSFGRLAGVAAALFYALHPATVLFERRAVIEPVLNLACLGLATVWLRGRWEHSSRPAVVCGVLLAVAASMKLWGVLWVIPCLAALPSGFGMRHLRLMAVSAGLTGAVIVGPMLLMTPQPFLTQTVLLHVWRPADGLGRADRVAEILRVDPAYAVATSFLVLGAAAIAWRGRSASKAECFWATAWVSMAFAFMAARAFFGHYVTHLMAPGAVLMGLGVSVLWRRAAVFPAVVRAAGVVVIAAAMGYAAVLVIKEPVRMPLRPEAARLIRAHVAGNAGLQAINPAWEIIGNRLPRAVPGRPLLIDAYSAMLLAAVEHGARFRDARSALNTPEAQAVARAAFLQSRFVATPRNSRWQLSPDTWRWLEVCYELRATAAGDDDVLDLWERRPMPSAGCTPALH